MVIALVICAYWACFAVVLPTASLHFGSTGALWVLTGTHPCGPPPRQNGGGYQSASSYCGLVEWIVDCGERVWNWEDRVRIPTQAHQKRCDRALTCPHFSIIIRICSKKSVDTQKPAVKRQTAFEQLELITSTTELHRQKPVFRRFGSLLAKIKLPTNFGHKLTVLWFPIDSAQHR